MAIATPNVYVDPNLTKQPVRDHLYISKKKVQATIKTRDGQLLVGNLYFRNANVSIRDELNGDMESFIAVTDVQDGKGGTIPFTFLLNFSQIIYVAVREEMDDLRDYAFEKHAFSVPRRKVEAYIRTDDGKNLSGSLHVRNTLNRTKDELNSREGRFLLLSDVKTVQGQIIPDLYFINKEHVIYFAVGDDRPR